MTRQAAECDSNGLKWKAILWVTLGMPFMAVNAQTPPSQAKKKQSLLPKTRAFPGLKVSQYLGIRTAAKVTQLNAPERPHQSGKRLVGTLPKNRPEGEIRLVSVTPRWQEQSHKAVFYGDEQFTIDVKPGTYDLKYFEILAFKYHMLREDLVIPEDPVLQLGDLSFASNTGIVIRLDGLHSDFEMPNVSLDVFRKASGFFQDMKPIFDVFWDIKDGLSFTGLQPGIYVLKLDNHKNKDVFDVSWSEKEIELKAGELKEVRLDVQLLRGCLVVLEDARQSLDTVSFRNPRSTVATHVSKFDPFDLTNHARFIDAVPGPWIIDATSKEGKTWSFPVTLPASGGKIVRLADTSP